MLYPGGFEKKIECPNSITGFLEIVVTITKKYKGLTKNFTEDKISEK